ncbi:hypothetical protein ACW9HG_37515 [Nocardia gipuzkoensis]
MTLDDYVALLMENRLTVVDTADLSDRMSECVPEPVTGRCHADPVAAAAATGTRLHVCITPVPGPGELHAVTNDLVFQRISSEFADFD